MPIYRPTPPIFMALTAASLLGTVMLFGHTPGFTQTPPQGRLRWNVLQFESARVQQWLNSPKVQIPDEDKPHINRWELSLYGKEYPEDSLAKRFDRLEKSLFKQTFHQYSTSRRFAHINEEIMGHVEQFNEPIEQSPAFKYMERRLTLEENTQKPVNQRLNAMENAVYGKAKPNLSDEKRFEQLVYDLPIKLSTTPPTNNEPEDLSPVEYVAPEPNQTVTPIALPATSESTELPSSPIPASNSPVVGAPIRIFIQGETLQQYWWSHQALAFWNNQHRVFQLVPTANMAQLVLAWHNNSPAILNQPQKQNPTSQQTTLPSQCPGIHTKNIADNSNPATTCLRELLGEAVLNRLY